MRSEDNSLGLLYIYNCDYIYSPALTPRVHSDRQTLTSLVVISNSRDATTHSSPLSGSWL